MKCIHMPSNRANVCGGRQKHIGFIMLDSLTLWIWNAVNSMSFLFDRQPLPYVVATATHHVPNRVSYLFLLLLLQNVTWSIFVFELICNIKWKLIFSSCASLHSIHSVECRMMWIHFWRCLYWSHCWQWAVASKFNHTYPMGRRLSLMSIDANR